MSKRNHQSNPHPERNCMPCTTFASRYATTSANTEVWMQDYEQFEKGMKLDFTSRPDRQQISRSPVGHRLTGIFDSRVFTSVLTCYQYVVQERSLLEFLPLLVEGLCRCGIDSSGSPSRGKTKKEDFKKFLHSSNITHYPCV